MCGCQKCVPDRVTFLRTCQVDDAFSALMDERAVHTAALDGARAEARAESEALAALMRAELTRAKRTLIAASFEDHGGEQWKPPPGKNPLPALDEARAELTQATARIKELETRLDEIAALTHRQRERK